MRRRLRIIAVLVLAITIVLSSSAMLLADDTYTEVQFDTVVYLPKTGQTTCFAMTLLKTDNKYYIARDDAAICGDFDLTTSEDCRKFVRKVYSLYDNSLLYRYTLEYEGEVIEYKDVSFFDLDEVLELLNVKIIYDGTTVFVFPREYFLEEIYYTLREIYVDTKMFIDTNSMDAENATLWNMIKDGSYISVLSGTEMVNEYASLLAKIAVPDDSIHESAYEVKVADNIFSTKDKIANTKEFLEHTHLMEYASEDGEGVYTRIEVDDQYESPVSSKDALFDAFNIDEKQWGPQISKLLSAGHELSDIVGNCFMMNKIRSTDPSYMRAIQYGVMVNPGTGTLLGGEAFTKDNRYMYDGAEKLYDQTNSSIKSLVYSIADEYANYAFSAITNEVVDAVKLQYYSAFKKVFFDVAGLIGINDHMDRVEYAGMCRFIMDKCAENFEQAKKDGESMKYCTLLYLKTFLHYRQNYASSVSGLETEATVKKLIAAISAYDDDVLYDISAQHVLTTRYTYSYCRGYETETSIFPYTYGIAIEDVECRTGNLEIPDEIDGFPVVAAHVSGEKNSRIKSIKVPPTVNFLNVHDLDKLERIDLPLYVRSFGAGITVETMCLYLSDLPSLEEFTVPSYVEDGSFYKMDLKSVTIKPGVRVGGCAEPYDTLPHISFGHCPELTEVNLPDGLSEIGDGAFYDCGFETLSIPNSVTRIGAGAFEECENLKSIVIPSEVKTLDKEAFKSCSSLESVTISEGVKTIGKSCFMWCKSLKTVILPKTLKSIGNSAFDYCRALEQIVIPDGVTSIGDGAFSNCDNLCEVSFPTTLKSIGAYCFSWCDSLETVVLPDSVTSIGEGAFSDCRYLKTVTLPHSLQEIGDWMFLQCYLLESIDIPNSVSTIGESAFYDCRRLSQISLPDGLTSIGEGAFGQCSELGKVVIPESVISLGEDAFCGATDVEYYAGPLNSADFGNCRSLTRINKDGSKTVLKGIPRGYKPGATTNLKAEPAGKNKVKLTWSAVSGAEGYLVYAQKDKKYAYVGMTTKGTTFTDNNALDTDYNFYWVFAYVKDENGKMNPGGCSKYVYAKGITTAVTNLKANGTTGKVTLSWTASSGADGYLIYGIRPGGKYGYIGMTTKGTTYTDTKADKSDWTFYWVFPYHKNGDKMIVGGTANYVYSKAR